MKCKDEGTIEEALESTGIGKFNLWISITTGFILFTVTNETCSIGWVVPSATCDLNLNLTQKTFLLTSGSIGVVTTQFFWGYLSDKVGRRNIMMYTLSAGFLCTLVAVCVPEFWVLVVFRYLNGAMAAGGCSLCFAYISKFFSANYRSIATLVTSIFIGLSLTAIPLSAWLIIPSKVSTIFGISLESWRLYMLVNGLPAVIACIALYISPESPKFLAQNQQNEKAIKIIHKMSQWNNVNTNKVIKKLTIEEQIIQDVKIQELFNRQYIGTTLVMSFIQVGMFATSGGLFLWYPDILQKIKQSKEEITVCDALNLHYFADNRNNSLNLIIHQCEVNVEDSVFIQNILIGSIYTILYILISFLVKLVGIKNIMMMFLGTGGAAILSLHFISLPIMIDILFVTLLVLPGVCVVVLCAAVAEMYPTHLRGMAVSLGLLSGRIGSIMSSSLIGYLLLWNCDVTFTIYGSNLIICTILVYLLPSINT